MFGSDKASETGEPPVDVKTLHAKIGELTLANDFLAGALGKAGDEGGDEQGGGGRRAHGPI